jgi:hypothetical protein
MAYLKSNDIAELFLGSNLENTKPVTHGTYGQRERNLSDKQVKWLEGQFFRENGPSRISIEGQFGHMAWELHKFRNGGGRITVRDIRVFEKK